METQFYVPIRLLVAPAPSSNAGPRLLYSNRGSQALSPLLGSAAITPLECSSHSSWPRGSDQRGQHPAPRSAHQRACIPGGNVQPTPLPPASLRGNIPRDSDTDGSAALYE